MAMSGGCLCGAALYEVSGEPIFVGSCYCCDCQKESGTGHTTVVVVSEAAAKVSGALKTYTKIGDSGKPVKRTFCPTCGTTLFGQSEAVPGTMAFRAGTLDDPKGLSLEMAIYVARAQPWDMPPAGLPAHQVLPQQG